MIFKKSRSNFVFWAKNPTCISGKWTCEGRFSALAHSKAGMNEHVPTPVPPEQAPACPWLQGHTGRTWRLPCCCLQKEVLAQVRVRQEKLFQHNVIFSSYFFIIEEEKKQPTESSQCCPLPRRWDGGDNHSARLLQRKEVLSPHRNYLCGEHFAGRCHGAPL